MQKFQLILMSRRKKVSRDNHNSHGNEGIWLGSNAANPLNRMAARRKFVGIVLGTGEVV